MDSVDHTDSDVAYAFRAISVMLSTLRQQLNSLDDQLDCFTEWYAAACGSGLGWFNQTGLWIPCLVAVFPSRFLVAE